MTQLIPFDPNNTEHCQHYFRLMKEAGDELSDDNNRDPILAIQRMARHYDPKKPDWFLVFVENEFAGYVGGLVDTNLIAYVEAAALKKFRRFYFAREALAQYCQFAFSQLGVRKIKSFIPLRQTRGRKQEPAEFVARAVGFRKEGLHKRELKYHGRYMDMLELALFPEQLRMNRHEQR